MQLKDKCLNGLVKSFSLVDSTFTQQGFRRCGKPEAVTYQLIIQDSATQSLYTLVIPTRKEHSDSNQYTVRIGRAHLKKDGRTEKLKPSMKIPEPIWNAVQSKLAEIADYLQVQKT
ncbi:hypothetical protein [Ammoniphilus sp. 3BR4]|uniref:hypothetical protein n=1 Tax=Ammoniphilus sp. 3BR4 TaxID=3158265 RepID=UPI0034662D40